MKIITQTKDFELPESIVVFGNFDGVHKGHQMLINEALYKETLHGYKTAFFTFEPHPLSVVMGKEPTDIVFTPEEKKAIVEEMGIDYYVEYPFTMEVAHTAPEVFVEEVIDHQLHAKFVIVGEDYRFGSKRAGDVSLLKELGRKYGFEVIAFPKLCKGDRCYSSTWLREVVKQGDMEAFTNLSGRPFRVRGKVEHGRGLGRTIGFPTANIMTPAYKILPIKGVYASLTTYDGKRYRSITNVGLKPGSEGSEMVVETFILDFDQMIYDAIITVELTHFMRGEVKLDSMEHLLELIKGDMKNLEHYFKDHPMI